MRTYKVITDPKTTDTFGNTMLRPTMTVHAEELVAEGGELVFRMMMGETIARFAPGTWLVVEKIDPNKGVQKVLEQVGGSRG